MGKTDKPPAETREKTATTRRTTRKPSGAAPQARRERAAPRATAHTTDGTKASGTASAASGTSAQPATERAEQVFDEAGQRVGQFARTAEHYLRQFTARAREEAEDIWVEAQNIRGKKP